MGSWAIFAAIVVICLIYLFLKIPVLIGKIIGGIIGGLWALAWLIFGKRKRATNGR